MMAVHKDLFRELLAGSGSREEAEASFYAGLCRLEALSLDGFARLDEALRGLGAPAGLRAALAQHQPLQTAVLWFSRREASPGWR